MTATPAHILVVEDERITAEDVKYRLTALGYTVTETVVSGEDALKTLEHTLPDLILMDIELKGSLNGVATAEIILRDYSVPVVFLTAYADKTTIEKAKKTEPYGFILKPFEDSELQGVIETALYKHGMEKQIQEHQAWLSTILHSIGDAVIATDSGGRIRLVNPVAEKLTGWSEAECLNRPVTDVLKIKDETSGKLVENPIQRVLASGKPLALSNSSLLLRKDGSELPIDDSAAPIINAANEVIGAVVNFKDVSERKQARDTLIKSEEKFKKFFRNQSSFAFMVSGDGVILDVNDAALRHLEYDRESLLGAPIDSLYAAGPAAGKTKKTAGAHTWKQSADAEVTLLTRSGRERTVLQNSNEVTDDGGRLLYSLVVQQDITELKQIEQQLKFTQFAVDHTAEAAFWMKDDASIIYVNDAACSSLGYTRKELLSMTIHDIDPLFLREDWQAHWKQVKKEKAFRLESRHRTKDGSTFPVEVTVNYLEFEGNQYNCAFAKNITLRKEREQLIASIHRIINHSPVIAITWTDARTWRISYVSENIRDVFGWDPESLVSGERTFMDLVHPDDRKRVLQEAAVQATKGRNHHFIHTPYRVSHKNGEYRWIEDRTMMRYDAEGHLVSLEGILVDVTEKQRMTEALKQSRQEWKEIFQAIGHPVLILSPDHDILSVNKAVVTLTGIDEEELIGKKCYDVFHNHHAPPGQCPMERMLKSGHMESVVMEMEALGLNFNISCTPVWGEDGTLQKIIHIATDITALKKAENALVESERLYRKLFTTSSEGILVAEVDSGRFRFANPAICRMLGYEEQEMLRMRMPDIHPADQLARVVGEFNSKVRGEKIVSYAIPCLKKSGETIYVNISASIVEIEGVTCNLGFFSDITDSIDADQALKESEQRYRKLYESSIDAIFTMQEDRFIDCNERTLELFDCTREQIISQPPYKFSPQKQPDGMDSKTKALMYIRNAYDGTPQLFEWTHIRHDGTPFKAEVSLIAIEMGTGKFLFATVRDISERKRTEAALVESEKKYKELANLLPQVVYETDAFGRISFINRKALTLFGYTRDDFDSGMKFISLLAPKDRKRAVAHFHKVMREGGSGGYEYTASRKDGSSFAVMVYANPVMQHGIASGLRGIIVDISREIETRESLIKSEQFYRQVIENSSGIPFRLIFGKNLGEGTYDLIGEGIKRLAGVPPEAFTEARFTSMIRHVEPMLPNIPEDPEICRKQMIKGKISSYKADICLETDAGDIKWLSDSSIPLRDTATGKVIGAFGILQDITRRKLAEEALRKSEKQYRTLIDQSNDAIYLLYKDRFLIVNEKFTEIFGYTLDDMNSPTFNFNDLIAPDSLQIIEDRKRRVREGKPIDPVYEFTAISKSGKPIECETSTSYLDYGDSVATQGIIRDITDRKQNEEKIKTSLREKEVLLKEIHHRVKNNLQIIASLINLQSRQISDPEMKAIYNDIKHRVHTMALIHEGLYRSGNFAKINFDEYLGNLTRHLYQAYHTESAGAEITLNIDDIALDIEQAIPCGLIVNELLTNAFKHAFTNRKKRGRIEVSFRKKAASLLLSVRDNGTGIPEDIDIATTDSLGLRLVHILAVDQLNGKLQVNRSGGTAITVIFKPGKS
ncbi:PAS domain S-box protein [bacterium]|nr:PAS domain S-box protein [bacterium]